MSVWSGWEADLLSHSSVPNTANNRRFLDDWHARAETNCNNNPIDLSVDTPGATQCAPLATTGGHARNYATSGDAVHAFSVQINQAAYHDLKVAMLTGNPYTADNTGVAAGDIAAWGSESFAQWYFSQTANAPGRGGGPVPVNAPQAHKGWADMRRSVNHHWPQALAASDRHIRIALRSIGKARKVRL